MKNRTLIGLGISCLAATLPAGGQVAPPATTSSPPPTAVEQADAAVRRAAAMELDYATQNYVAAVDHLDAVQRDLRKETRRLDVAPESLQKAAARLDEQLEIFHLDEVGSAARRQATETAIKEEADRAEKRMKDDPVAAELQKVVAAREDQMKQALEAHRAGVATQSEMQLAQIGLAEAKAKVAERQHAVFTGGDSETLAALRRDLLNITISEQERTARMAYLKQQQDRLSDAMNALPQLQRRQEAIESARRLLDRAEERVQMLRIYGSAERGGRPPDAAEKR